MPIEARRPKTALFAFKDRLNEVLRATITQRPLIGALTEQPPEGATGEMWLSFRDPGYATEIPLGTRYGEVRLVLTQRCVTRRALLQHRVSTESYAYTIAVPGAREPFIRWEYMKRWPDDSARWCRHHVQGPMMVPVGGSPGVSMNDFHAPTGYVTVEDVIRFCLHDLDVRPLSENWHEVLEDSYEDFRSKSTPPR